MSPIYYAKNILLEGYRAVIKANIGVIHRIYFETQHSWIENVFKAMSLQIIPQILISWQLHEHF